MKVMFIVYHDLHTEARSQEILECAHKLGNAISVSFSTPIDKSKYKYILTGSGKRNYFSFFWDSVNAVRKEKPEIIILHDNYTAPILWFVKAFYSHLFIVYDSSELYIESKFPTSFKKFAAEIFKLLEKKYLKCADVVIAANIERAKIMEEYFKLDELPLVFDNIHKIEDDYQLQECDKKYISIFKKETFNIVYGGGIARGRLTFELAAAVGQLGPKYQLIVVGSATDRDKQEFCSMLKKEKFFNVHYLGFIPRNEWRYLLHRAHISVSAFAENTINNINCASGKLYESLFEGTPVLTTNNPPLRRICSMYNVGVGTNDFAGGILKLEKNYDFYKANVNKYIETINVNARVDILVNNLREKITESSKRTGKKRQKTGY